MSAGHDVPAAGDAITCGPLWISPDEFCQVRVRGRPVSLPAANVRVLARLVVAGGRILSRAELTKEATGRDPNALESRAVDLRILRIRRALGPLGRYLITVPTRGYRLDVEGLSRAG